LSITKEDNDYWSQSFQLKLHRSWTPNSQAGSSCHMRCSHSGPPKAGSDPGENFLSGPIARADRQGEKDVNKADSVVRKMAAGRKCHQPDKRLPNYIWYYRERQKNTCSTVGLRAPFRNAGPR
jgi:hypothetical protein